MTARLRLAIGFGLLAATPARGQLRELTTDRPDKTEMPHTVDSGRFQIEFDLTTWTRDRADGVRTDTWAVLPFNLKYGLDESTDVELIVQPYLRRIARGRGGRKRVTGFGDTTVRLKRNFRGNNGGPVAIGAIAFVTLPTSHADLGDDKVTGGLIVPLELHLSDAVELGAMTEVDLAEGERGEYTAALINSASLGLSLSDKLGLYGELYTERATQRGSRWIVTGDTGITYKIGENLQLDAGVNLGLTDAADDVMVFAGVSRRF